MSSACVPCLQFAASWRYPRRGGWQCARSTSKAEPRLAKDPGRPAAPPSAQPGSRHHTLRSLCLPLPHFGQRCASPSTSLSCSATASRLRAAANCWSIAALDIPPMRCAWRTSIEENPRRVRPGGLARASLAARVQVCPQSRQTRSTLCFLVRHCTSQAYAERPYRPSMNGSPHHAQGTTVGRNALHFFPPRPWPGSLSASPST